MCLVSRTNIPSIADEDIVVYKVLVYQPIADRYVTPFMLSVVDINHINSTYVKGGQVPVISIDYTANPGVMVNGRNIWSIRSGYSLLLKHY